jgi:predicted ATPase
VTPTVLAFAGFPAPGPLLERERELAALRTAIAEVVEGRPRVVMVAGSAGIGKTRLLAEARRLAADAGLRVLVARGGELEREFAFGVVRQLFEASVAGDASALRGAAAAAGGVFEPGEHAGDGFAEDPSFALLHGLYWVTVNVVGDAPLVIVVDDLHWCDGPSLRFLAYLVRRLEGLPVLVLGSVRPSEWRGESALLAEFAGDPLTVSIDLGPLSERAALRLVREWLGEGAEEAFAIACHAITGGNPLLLGELLKTLAVEGVRPSAAGVSGSLCRQGLT